jgi:hypothetical protein
MDNFEEALKNIDVFCKTLVKKMTEEENGQDNSIVAEPMEKLLRKYVIEENSEPSPLAKSLIPMPQAEEPLVDVFEDNDYVKVLMQCRCKDHKVTVHPEDDGVEICKRECHTNDEGMEVCRDDCQKVALSNKQVQVENMIMKCSNNTVFEINIPKNKTPTV